MVDYIAFCYDLMQTTEDHNVVQLKYMHRKELGGVLLSLKCLSDRPKSDSATGTMPANFQPTRGEFLKITPWEMFNHSSKMEVHVLTFQK